MLHGHSENELEFPGRDRRKVTIKFKYKIKTLPAVEPVLTPEMELFIKDVETIDLPLLDSLTVAARLEVEKLTGLALIEQTWTAYSDILPGRIFELRFGRIISVTTIKVFADDGSSETVPAADYYVAQGDPRIALKHGGTWPSIGQEAEGFQVEFKTGFGTAGSDVPADIIAAIKQLTTLYYEYREPIVFGNLPADIKFTLDTIIRNNKIWNI